MSSTPGISAAAQLRRRLEQPELLVAPGCFDAFSAKLIERAGFDAAFMSGFAVAGARAALPDTGLLSYGEVLDHGRSICEAVDIPIIGDADTGYGNALNVKRTIRGYAAAGFAVAMIEDQVAPKQCGHTAGKQTVDRHEAAMRITAAVDAREEGADILVMARTDARATEGLDAAIDRCRMFRDLGADITFLEAPADQTEMARYCDAVDGPKVVNLVEQGSTPIPNATVLTDLGYAIAFRPLTLLLAAATAMQRALADLGAGAQPAEGISFQELQSIVGFPEYFAAEERYR